MPRKPPKGKSLAEVNPELAKQWHTSKNENITPSDVSYGSRHKAWWKCNKGEDHEWEASIRSRSSGQGCSICAGKKVVLSNCLETLSPKLSKEWHLNKNSNLTPRNVSSRSSKKVWWKCNNAEDHEWEAIIVSRVNGRGCPFCSHRIFPDSKKENSLAKVYPDLLKEWDHTLNKKEPFKIYPNSNKKAFWICSKDNTHKWSAKIINRTANQAKCPYCTNRKVNLSNCLSTTHPEIAQFWSNKNKLQSTEVTRGSNKVVWWNCEKGHEWEGIIKTKKKDSCPICTNQLITIDNCLATTHPDLLSQWHQTMNKRFTAYQISAGSHKKVWWKCDKGEDHEWYTSPGGRTQDNLGCPFCSHRKVSITNSLYNKYPKLAEQWHPTLNGNLTPKKVVGGGLKSVWWKCNKGVDHEWKTTINSRIDQGSGCPYCSNRYVSVTNSLEAKYPKLAKQWHPKLNGDLTPDKVVHGTHKTIWWKCNKGEGHEWKTHGTGGRTQRDYGCPFCTLTPQSRQELIITFELIQFFKGINPRGYKASISGKIRSLDIYIPTLNLGIEFDGAYFHKDKVAKDKLKTLQFKKEGFDIFRVRQQSKQDKLKKLTKNDVISKYPYNGKELVNNVLKQIMKMYELDAKKIAKIESYIAKKELQNEKAYDKYIDMIFTEKAEKNN